MFSKINNFVPRIIGITLTSFSITGSHTEKKPNIDVGKIIAYKKDLVRRCIVDDNQISNKKECEPVVKLADSFELFERCKTSSTNLPDDNCIEKFIYQLSIDRVNYSKIKDTLNRDLTILAEISVTSEHFQDHMSKIVSGSSTKELPITTKINNEISDKISVFNKCLDKNKNETDNSCLEKMLFDMSNIRIKNPQFCRQIMNITLDNVVGHIKNNKELNNKNEYAHSRSTAV